MSSAAHSYLSGVEDRLALRERFDAKWEEDPAGCWIWTAYRCAAGYGRIAVRGEALVAHRVGYELYVGPVAKGLDLDHLCRIRHCVNPTHLEPVTRRENCLRGERKTKIETCREGHPLDGVFGKTKRQRYCKTCNRARMKKRYEEQGY